MCLGCRPETQEIGTVTVWSNTTTHVYHCPNDTAFGKTRRGQYLSESEAIRLGFRPARGHSCQAKGTSRVTKCGVDRWLVKTVLDRDAGLISSSVVRTTVSKLNQIPMPEGLLPQQRRVIPVEVTTYQVEAVLLRIKQEDDSDLHLVLKDLNNDETLIAEIPSPECAIGSLHSDSFKNARNLVQDIDPGTKILVTGIGFFDKEHDQFGASSNGIEIHPVIRIRSLP